MDNYYLIWLSGQGDTEVKVVDQETWDWINDPTFPLPTPAAVTERKKLADGDEWYEPLYETSGSYNNDRAMYAPGIVVDGVVMSDYTGGPEAADDVAEWKALLKIDRFADDFRGCIY